MKLLYIKCNPKPEAQSSCLRVGREFVRRYAMRFPGDEIEELDLYATELPEVDGAVFNGRSGIAEGDEYGALDDAGREKADRVGQLCEQFQSADRYAVAAPMWSLTFPSRLKAYIDCVVIDGRTIRVTPRTVEGLLCGKPRRAVFIQSCGGTYGNLISARFNYAATYLKNLFFFLGMEDFIRLPVDGTGQPDIGVEAAVNRAVGRIDKVLECLAPD